MTKRHAALAQSRLPPRTLTAGNKPRNHARSPPQPATGAPLHPGRRLNTSRERPACPRSKPVDFLLERVALGFELFEPGPHSLGHVVYWFRGVVDALGVTHLNTVDLVLELLDPLLELVALGFEIGPFSSFPMPWPYSGCHRNLLSRVPASEVTMPRRGRAYVAPMFQNPPTGTFPDRPSPRRGPEPAIQGTGRAPFAANSPGVMSRFGAGTHEPRREPDQPPRPSLW